MNKTILLALLIVARVATAEVFYVAPAGNDSNAGTAEKPFATLERARDAARAATNRTGLTVVVRGGIYQQSKTLELNANDSGANGRPVMWRSAPGEAARIIGGTVVSASAIRPVKDTVVLQRVISQAARERLLEINLAALGVRDFGQIGPRGFRRPVLPAPVELMIGGQVMPMVIWPKMDQPPSPIGKVLDKGSAPRYENVPDRGAKFLVQTERPSRWQQTDDLWITGFFANGYADATLQLASIVSQDTNIVFSTAQPHVYGFSSGKPWNNWRALNVLEEISLPGEWAVDRKAGKLYFLPPTNYVPGQTEITVSTLASPVLAFKGASNLRFENLHIGCSRGDGVAIHEGEAVVFSECQFRNLGGVAATFDAAGRGHRLENSVICDTGAGGVKLDGGDRPSLKPGSNTVFNCEIHHFNRWNRTYSPAVAISGVGNRIAYCLIHDAPGCAILLHGNNHLIENNEIHNVMEDGDDMGAFYMGRNPTEFGNVIRYNYFHDVGFGRTESTYGIYLDDCSCGTEVYGNLLVRAGRRAAFIVGGGKHHKIHDNIIVESKLAFHIDDRAQKPFASMDWYPKDIVEALDKMNVGQPPYSIAYPQLATYWQDNPKVPTNSIIGNLLVRCKQLTNGKLEWGGFQRNWQTDTDPGFVNEAKGDFTLKPGAEVFKYIPGFKPGDFRIMGIEKQ